MSRFSDRNGVTTPKTVLQTDDIDTELRNSLWNAVLLSLSEIHGLVDRYENRTAGYYFSAKLWIFYFKRPIDEMPNRWTENLASLKKVFLNGEWYVVYNLVEAILQAIQAYESEYQDLNSKTFRKWCNLFLTQEMSGYRLVGSHIVAITSEEEMSSVNEALNLGDRFKPVSSHLGVALALMSDKKNPDWRNSIKESISSVEAACKIITGDTNATLGQALKILEAKGVNIHTALGQGFAKLYGWTSDADGIRHALMKEEKLDFDDAKFMLVACSAFVNFLKVKAPLKG